MNISHYSNVFSTIFPGSRNSGRDHFDKIVIAGASGVGKTTLVNAIRRHPLCLDENIIVPQRLITRPRRDNDDLLENRHVSADLFQKKIRNDELAIYWTRKLEEDRIEKYGFEYNMNRSLSVYSCNNALFTHENCNDLIKEWLSGAIVLGVFAPDEVREGRLLKRSPIMMSNKAEAAHRLYDRAEDINMHSHLIIHTYPYKSELWAEEAAILLDRLYQHWRPRYSGGYIRNAGDNRAAVIAQGAGQAKIGWPARAREMA